MALEKTGVELVADNAAKFNSDMDKAAKSVKDFGDDADTASGGVEKGSSRISMAFAGIGTAAVGAAIEVAKAVGAMVVDTVKAAGDFEANVNKFGAVSGLSGDALDAVRDKALQLGQDTAFSAGEAQQAMIELAKGGVPIADVMGDATDATLNLAASAGIELTAAAEIVSKQLGVWREKGLTATQAVDLIAQAANASTVGVEELALGLANAGGTAKVGGVEFAELTQTIASISANFNSAGDAGTALKTMLSRLTPQTDRQYAAFAELGLVTADGNSKFYDAEGAFVGMAKAAELLQGGLQGLSEEQKVTALTAAFGSEGINAASALATLGAERFDAMGTAMAGLGTAQEQAAKMNVGFNFTMEQMNGSIETLQIAIGDKLLPIATELITKITEVVNSVLGWVRGTDEASGSMTETWGTFGKDFEDIWKSIQSIATTLWETLQKQIAAFQVFWAEHGAAIMQVAKAAWDVIIGVIRVALAVIDGLVKVWSALLEGNWKKVWAALEGMMAGIGEGLAKALGGIGQILIVVMQKIVWGVMDVWTNATADAGPKFQRFASDLAWYLHDAVSGVWQQIVDLGTTIVQGIASGIVSAGGAIWEAIKGAIQAAMGAITGFIQSGSPSKLFAVQVGEPIGEGTAMGITDTIPQVSAAAGVLAQSAIVGAQSIGGSTSNTSTVNNNYNLGVTTQQPSRGVIQDFGMMRTFAAAGR